jgi:hypothetical protein
MSKKNLSRRSFVQAIALAAPAGAAVWATPAVSADMPKLDVNDPTAKALIYVEKGADVDTSNPLASRFEPSQTCANCVQIQGQDGEAWRPCAIFPGKLVAADGWCSVWAAKP